MTLSALCLFLVWPGLLECHGIYLLAPILFHRVMFPCSYLIGPGQHPYISTVFLWKHFYPPLCIQCRVIYSVCNLYVYMICICTHMCVCQVVVECILYMQFYNAPSATSLYVYINIILPHVCNYAPHVCNYAYIIMRLV